MPVVAGVELVSLVVLLANLATVHWPAVAAAVGPVHGCAYLVVIILAFARTRDARTRLVAVLPGVGGLLALRRLTPAERT